MGSIYALPKIDVKRLNYPPSVRLPTIEVLGSQCEYSADALQFGEPPERVGSTHNVSLSLGEYALGKHDRAGPDTRQILDL